MRAKPAHLLAAVLILAPATAFAHTGAGSSSGFAHGFAHPMTGLDHVLAMVAVGLLAWQIGGRALWMVPLSFVVAMAAGGALGVAGWDLPAVEIGIALSVVALGAVVAIGLKLPTAVAVALAAAFAVFHGHAHGAEMPQDASGLAYGAGFMIATALLHLAGIGVGIGIGWLSRSVGPAVVRASGAAIAVVGLGILVGIA